jgi:heavy metal sensor kinase
MSWWSTIKARTRLAILLIASQAVVVSCFAVLSYASQSRIVYARLDHQLDDDIENAEQLLERTPEGALHWRAGDHHDGSGEPTGDLSIEVFDASLKPLYKSPNATRADLGAPPSVPEHLRSEVASLSFPGELRLRVLSGGCAVGGKNVVIRAARSDGAIREQLRSQAIALGVVLGAMVLLATLSGYALARRALSPVAKMAERAKAITAEKLSERLPVENADDELGKLATVFNETLARLEHSFEQLRRFTSDASHELRTPLTAIKTVGQVGLRDEKRDAKAYREVIGSMLEEADRLTHLVDALLTLSRADAGRIPLKPEKTDLAELVREVTTHLGVLAEEKQQTLTVETNGTLPITVDRLVLRQAVVNLVDNAIKYTPEGRAIRVVARPHEGEAQLEVEDEGPGIAPEHRERVFDRFFRIDPARSPNGGAGLGLAIARWAVEAHGGRLELESEPGRGSRFRIVLPTSVEPRGA